MITREQTDAKISEIRTKTDIDATIKQTLIDEALTKEANQLIPGNNLAIIQTSVFMMLLIGFLQIVKYSLLPLFLL